VNKTNRRTEFQIYFYYLLTTNHEVPGSIPSSTMGIFHVGRESPWWLWSG